MDPSDAPNPTESDNPTDTPMNEVIRRLEEQGYTGGFSAAPEGRVTCLTCRSTEPAAAYRADELTRLEGASDPADMMVIIPLRCPVCGTFGLLVLGYGPGAAPEDGDVIADLDRHPAEVPGSTPGIAQ